MVTADGGGTDWERFATDVGRMVDAPPAEVRPETRIFEDLGYDSLALAELVVTLIDEYEMEGLADSLGERTWEGVTAGQLFEECCSQLSARR
jgi:acyl carrier protein